jgi:myo-inositol 2-dehydrogenase/D-chiro-inositol 1-dehydrogenase
MTLRIGIVGAGTHGARYLRHATNDVEGLRVVAICRRDRAAGEALAAAHGCRHVPDGHALIADAEVDAVVVTTPPSSHFTFALAALAAGKAVLVEKPVTGTLAQARRLVTMAGAAGAPPLMVAQTLRWNPVLARARELWPRLGRVHLIRLAQRLAPTNLTWQQQEDETVGGSVLLTGVHIFDLARWLSGREFVTIASRQRRVLNPVVEDLFLARGELDDGCWVSLEVSKFTDSRAGWLEAVGEAGQLHADYLGGTLRLRLGREESVEHFDAAAPTLPAVLAAWREAALRRAVVPVTAVDGLRTLEVADACYRSDAAGGAAVVCVL